MSPVRTFSRRLPALVFALAAAGAAAFDAGAQVLFDFDSAPLHGSFPMDLVQSGITAHLAATGQGMSIQEPYPCLGYTPVGFSGYLICPNSVYSSDLLVGFDVVLSDFSILVAPHELACDTTATLRVTGYRGATFVATATSTAAVPGTWPSSTLALSAPQGFDNVVVHYDSPPPPPPCDYGAIFVADNMTVTLADPIFANGFE